MAYRTTYGWALRWLLALIVVGGGAWLADAFLGHPQTGIDDADIFFAYARNLIEGHGLVYNVGGERVEGYSSTVWMLVCAAAHVVSSEPEALLRGVSLLLVSGALAVGGHFLDAYVFSPGGQRPGWAGAWLFPLVVCLQPGFVVWTTLTLMDSGLWAAWLLTLAVTVAKMMWRPPSPRESRWLVAGIALLPWVRPEGVGWAAVFVGALALSPWVRRRSMEAQKEAEGDGRLWLHALVASAGALGALVAWRLVYFGFPLPNTVYAKAGGVLGDVVAAGLSYGYDFITSIYLALPVVLAAALWVGKGCWTRRGTPGGPTLREEGGALGLFLAVALAGASAVVLSGGDHFGGMRRFQPHWPIYVLMGMMLTHAFVGRQRLTLPRGVAWAVGLCAVAVTVSPGWASFDELRVQVEFDIARDGRDVGVLMARVLPELPSVGVSAAGGVRLTYPGAVVDMMGLNSVAMAHHDGPRYGPRNHTAFNAEVLLAAPPDLLLPARCDSARVQAWHRRGQAFVHAAMKGALRNPEFLTIYQHRAVRRPGSQGILCVWVHKDYLRDLEADEHLSLAIIPLNP